MSRQFEIRDNLTATGADIQLFKTVRPNKILTGNWTVSDVKRCVLHSNLLFPGLKFLGGCTYIGPRPVKQMIYVAGMKGARGRWENGTSALHTLHTDLFAHIFMTHDFRRRLVKLWKAENIRFLRVLLGFHLHPTLGLHHMPTYQKKLSRRN